MLRITVLIITILPSHQSIAARAARDIAEAIKEKSATNSSFVLGLATGTTMDPLYDELVRMHKEDNLDFSSVICFNLDNYVGLSTADKNNFCTQLQKRFLDSVNCKPENIHLIGSEPDFNHESYEQLIQAVGGIDIQLLGIGGHGHIAFNEVGSSIDSQTRTVELSERTKIDNGKYFNQINKETGKMETIPLTAHTRGIAPILEARRILFLANGHNKALVMRELCKAGTVETLPARALHQHPNITILADSDALSLFSEDMLAAHTTLDSSERESHIKRHAFHSVSLSTQSTLEVLLPPDFDFYDPRKMDIDEVFNQKNQTHLDLLAEALAATEHLCVGAHPDDAEIMAGPLMLSEENNWLIIIVTNGAAVSNTLNGVYATHTPEELTKLRQKEQREAAQCANVPVIMCKFPSAAITGDMGQNALQNTRKTMRDLLQLMPKLRLVCGHNPLDTHDTHISTFVLQCDALRSLSSERLSNITIWGMEVWGILHVAEHRLLKLPIETEEKLSKWGEMISVYKSQIAGQGRDYSQSTIERARGNAGYQTHPHGANPPPALLLGVELTDFIHNMRFCISKISATMLSELSEHIYARTQRLYLHLPTPGTEYKKSGNHFFTLPEDASKTTLSDTTTLPLGTPI